MHTLEKNNPVVTTLKRVPKLKSEMALRSNIAYNNAINVLKVEHQSVGIL
jgi:hypothetical protein